MKYPTNAKDNVGDLQDFSSKMQALQERIDRLEAACVGRNDRVTLQLADNVTGVTGLKEVVTTKPKILQYVWAILFLGGIAATVYFIYATTTEYLDEPTVTKIKLENQSYYTYPPIVLCNDAWFDYEKAIGLGLTPNALKYSFGYLGVDYAASQLSKVELIEARSNFLDIYAKHGFTDVVQYYKAIAIDVAPVDNDKDILSYDHNNTVPAYFIDDTADDFVPARKVYLPGKAICQEFNFAPAKGRTAMLAGPPILHTKWVDMTYGFMAKNSSRRCELHLSTGLDALYAFPSMVEPFKDMQVEIKVEKVVHLNRQSDPCFVNEMDKSYSGTKCLFICANDLYMKDKGCKLFYIETEDSQLTPADSCNFYDFEDPSNATVTDAWLVAVGSECTYRCPRRCERIVYYASVKGEAELPLATPSSFLPNVSIYQITVLHDALNSGGILALKEASSYSFTELVNNIGGTLGLFIGGTIMTLPQIILFFVNYMLERRRRAITVKEHAVA